MHQCVYGYVDAVLEREDFDYVIFNGDWFDTRVKRIDGVTYAGMKQTCLYINDLRRQLGDKAIFHIGNHDVTYMASYNPDYIRTMKKDYHYYSCSGWTRNKAKKFNKYIDPSWFDDLKLCSRVGDYHVSHAGFHYWQFMLPMRSEIDNIQYLYDQWEEDKGYFMNTIKHWIYQVGECRGGNDRVGSPVWLDWNQEFYPIDNVKQIVGHTPFYFHRAKGDNVNIDTMQNSYAVWDNGLLQVKYLIKPLFK